MLSSPTRLAEKLKGKHSVTLLRISKRSAKPRLTRSTLSVLRKGLEREMHQYGTELKEKLDLDATTNRNRLQDATPHNQPHSPPPRPWPHHSQIPQPRFMTIFRHYGDIEEKKTEHGSHVFWGRGKMSLYLLLCVSAFARRQFPVIQRDLL